MIVKKDKLPPKNLLIKNLFEKRATKIKKLEFKINEYITLKLENGKTNIYVKNELFQQCENLLLNIPVENLDKYDEIQSNDVVTEGFDKSLEYKDSKNFSISPETEFWGYCSNLQAWAENEYDTRLLHRNIAFSLLKQLTQVGDPKAKKVFKEEITKRFLKGNYLVREYLVFGAYLDYLNKEELVCVFEEYLKLLEASYNKETKEKEVEYNKSIKIPRGYISLDAKYYSFWSRIGSNYRKKKQIAKAIDAYMEAYRINPIDISIIKFLIMIYYRKGEYKFADYFLKRKNLFFAINKIASRDYTKSQKIKFRKSKRHRYKPKIASRDYTKPRKIKFRKLKRRRYKPKKPPKIR